MSDLEISPDFGSGRWKVERALYGAPVIDQMLSEGWEPFATAPFSPDRCWLLLRLWVDEAS